MKREELQHDFYNERGIGWINSQGEPDIDYVMWLEDKILATKNVSLPPAEGAEQKPKKKLSAHSFWSWYSRDYKTFMVTSTNEIHFDIEDLWRFMDAYAAQQQPTAEGAEEILFDTMTENNFTYVSFPAFVENESSVDVFDIAVKATEKFATLHAQKIADKMVEERLREELIKYDRWLCSPGNWGNKVPSPTECVDEYLKNVKK